MRFSKRNPDRDLERKLRADRPEPSAEFTRSISDRVRPRRRGFARGGLYVPIGLAGGVSAVVLTIAIAFGGGAATVSPTTVPSTADTQNTALFRGFSFSPVRATPAPPQATQNQYGNFRTICLLGRTTITLPRAIAQLFVALGIATFGPCDDDDDDDDD